MNSLFSCGAGCLRWMFGLGLHSSSRIAVDDIEIEVMTPEQRVLSSSDLVQRVADYFTLQDFVRFSRLTKGMYTSLNSEKYCLVWQQRLESLYPNVRNLDKLGAGPLLGFPKDKKQEPIESIKHLAAAVIISKRSQGGYSTILTIPADWTIDKLEAISVAAVYDGIPSAAIEYGHPLDREILQPVQEEQTVVISDGVIKDDRDYSGISKKAFLKAKGFTDECPSALRALTAAVVTRILTRGRESLYELTYTIARQKKDHSWQFALVGSSPISVRFRDYYRGSDDTPVSFLVGAERTFRAVK